MGGSQRDNDSSPNLSFNDLKQKEIEIKEGSALVLWYETQLLIGPPNGSNWEEEEEEEVRSSRDNNEEQQ